MIPINADTNLLDAGTSSVLGRRTMLRALGATVVSLAAGSARATSQAGICSFGVFPYLPALKIGDLYAPAAVDLGEALGTQIQLQTKNTFEEFADELEAGSYDFVLVHPFLYLAAQERQGYRPIARIDQQLRAVLVGRSEHPVERLTQLRGETIAMVPLTAVAELLRATALDEGLTIGRDLQLAAHQTKMSCLQSAASGEAVGCVIPSTLGDQLPEVGKLNLVPIWQSEPICSHVVAVHPRMPGAAVERLQQRLIGWTETAAGVDILHRLSWPRLVPATDADFEPIRTLAARLRAASTG